METARGRAMVAIGFSAADCMACPSRALCTRAKTGARNVTLQARPEHEAIRAARQRQQSAEFAAQYAPRAGIEGTLSQGIRAFGLRKARYRGLAKTHLQHVATATAINLVRLADWLNGTPARPPDAEPLPPSHPPPDSSRTGSVISPTVSPEVCKRRPLTESATVWFSSELTRSREEDHDDGRHGEHGTGGAGAQGGAERGRGLPARGGAGAEPGADGGGGQPAPGRRAARADGGAGAGSGTGTASGTGTRGSGRSSCGCRACGTASYFPALLEPRKRAEQALVAVVREAYVHGVSTRRVDELVQALGLDGISKSQVSRLCETLDAEVERFRHRPLDGAYPYVWLDATFVKVRDGGRVVSMAVVLAIGVRRRRARGARARRRAERGWRVLAPVPAQPGRARPGRGPAGHQRRPRGA